jgi:hypothetical protein
MERVDTSNPMWAGFLELVRSILLLEIGVFIYYSLITAGEMFP